MKVLNAQILVNRVITLDGGLVIRNCKKHLKDVTAVGKYVVCI